jgi:hypothetical protein
MSKEHTLTIDITAPKTATISYKASDITITIENTDIYEYLRIIKKCDKLIIDLSAKTRKSIKILDEIDCDVLEISSWNVDILYFPVRPTYNNLIIRSSDNIKIPDIIICPNITLDCSLYYVPDHINCSKLCITGKIDRNEIPETLTTVEDLTIYKDNDITEIPETLINLKKLYIWVCGYITNIPETLINLTILDIGGYNLISEIPGTLIKLESLTICGANSIAKIPKTLINLIELDISGSNHIAKIPETLIKLESLTICGSNIISEIPGTLINLSELIIDGYNTIAKIPETLIKLIILDIRGLNTISEIPKTLINLTTLKICGCAHLSLPTKIHQI